MNIKKNKYAICLLAFNNDVYLTGALIAGFIHKQYINKFSLDIDILLMIDKSFEKYIFELKNVFDKISVINLTEINLSPEYKIHKKYSHWLKYSINKWQVLNFEEYDKILFCDTEIVPMSEKWYHDLFNLKPPAFLSKGKNNNYGKIITKDIITNKELISSEDYRTSSKYFQFTIDAGLVLLEPNKMLYEEYLNFVKFAEGKSGYISSNISGADETTLLLFTIFYKQLECRLIPYNYAVITWENHSYDKNNIEGLNFLSYIKPWVKPELIQWSDERLWHQIAECMFKKYDIEQIKKVYIKLQVTNLYEFLSAIKKNLTNKIPYNYEAYTEKQLKFKTIKFLHFLKRKKIYKDDFSFMKKMLNDSKNISNDMLKITDVDQSKIIKNVCL